MPSGLSRRGFLTLAAAAPLALHARLAAAETVGAAQVGSFRVTPLRDGLLPVDAGAVPAAESTEGRGFLREAGLSPAGPWQIPVNAFLISRAGRHWLLDAGCGTALGPGYGQVVAALAAEGIRPEQIETVWLTHLHADHAGGLLGPDRSRRFPNAEVVLQTSEVAYWSDDGARARASSETAPLFEIARAVLGAYAGRIRMVSGEVELTAGVHAVPLPGHTPGHAGVLVADGSERLLIWGDVVHLRGLQMQHPQCGLVYDVDQVEAAAIRKRVLDRAVVERFVVAGMHLDGAGLIERSGTGYRLA